MGGIVITVKELCRIENKVYDLSASLTAQLEILGKAASEILGYQVVADLCNGEEIEFRIVEKEDIADSNSCIRMEEVIDKLKYKK